MKKFLESGDEVLVCTHATFRFAVEKFGVEAFDEGLIAVDEFHHVSANPDSRLGDHVRQFMARDIGYYFYAALRDSAQKNNRDHVDLIIALGMAKEGFDWI